MNDKENRLYHFDELIKTLITLSFSADRQLEILGFGCIVQEMGEDFDWHFGHYREEYLENGFMNQEQVKVLDGLEKYLSDRSGKDEYLDFWTDNRQLSKHPDWAEIRKIAKQCLLVLKKEHLDLKVTIVNKPEKGEKGEDLIIQSIKTDLVERGK